MKVLWKVIHNSWLNSLVVIYIHLCSMVNWSAQYNIEYCLELSNYTTNCCWLTCAYVWLLTEYIFCRYYYMCQGMEKFFKITDSDILYTSLPLYHTNANILGIGQMITHGSTIALRKKFSASNFWNDCIKYQCTVSCLLI